ncbi:carbamate kinase [Providencia stuartii]|uniref:carbamate kinase n=1 Tax=Providencia stuartii TaxID=588 RepID=UPI000A8CBF56
MKELVVVAIGGNSIIKDNNGQSIEAQEKAVQEVASHVCDMLEGNYNIVLTHGNGPQVGLDLRRAEIAHTVEGLPLTPLANCVADTQGGIGYLIQQALTNALAKRHHRQAVTIVTQVEVDKNDPNFHSPTKPIGAFFSLEQAEKLKKANPDWHFVEDSGRGYRRVVASPAPKSVIESAAIQTLSENNYVVIAAGGGGIPVIKNTNGGFQSVDAVIDKDLSTTLLAKELKADILIITTGVEKCVFTLANLSNKRLGRRQQRRCCNICVKGIFQREVCYPKLKLACHFSPMVANA